jgi:peptidoglycan/LPS O-acetylase OafA/YrhL
MFSAHLGGSAIYEPRSSSKIRGDIQGLRAVAVIAVVLFHSGLALPGGFVGVDIFLVVSGFVITSSLLRERITQGRILLWEFYKRRFKRLFPAIAVMISITMLVTSYVLSPLGPQQTAGITGIAALFGAANGAIALTTGGYFDAAAELNPLLHTWTLSAEEQFYLIFPIALMLGIFWSKQRVFRGTGFVICLGVLVSFSLALVDEIFPNIPGIMQAAFGFYSPVTRAWEFCAGAAVAWFLLRWTGQINQNVAKVMYFFGAVLIGVSFSSVSVVSNFPGTVTLLPVIGTVLMILAGSVRLFSEAKWDLLGSRPAMQVGSWSYSIYLWHWPFIALVTLIYPENQIAVLVAIALSLIPALASFYFIETPFRKRSYESKLSATLALAAVVMFPLSILLTTLAGANIIKESLGSPLAAPIGYQMGCHGPGAVEDELGVCNWVIGEESQANGAHIYLVGDSHAAQYTDGLRAAALTLGRNLSVLTASSCPFLDLPQAETLTPCWAWQQKALRYLLASPRGTVVIASSDEYWISDDPFVFDGTANATDSPQRLEILTIGLKNAVHELDEVGHELVFVEDTPHWLGASTWSLQRCTMAQTLTGCNQSQPISDHLLRTKALRETVESASARYSFEVIDFLDVVCKFEVCRTYREGSWVYRDSGHLTNSFSGTLAPKWVQVLGGGG